MKQRQAEEILSGFLTLHAPDAPQQVKQSLRGWLTSLQEPPDLAALQAQYEKQCRRYEEQLKVMEWLPGDIAVHEDFGCEVLRAVIGKVKHNPDGSVAGADYTLFVCCPCCGAGINNRGYQTAAELCRYPRQTGEEAAATRRHLEESLQSDWKHRDIEDAQGAQAELAELQRVLDLPLPPLNWDEPLPPAPALTDARQLQLVGIVAQQLSCRSRREFGCCLHARVAEGAQRLAAHLAAHGLQDAALDPDQLRAIVGIPDSPFHVGDVLRPKGARGLPGIDESVFLVQEVTVERSDGKDQVLMAATKLTLARSGWYIEEWSCNCNSLKPSAFQIYQCGESARQWLRQVIAAVTERQKRDRERTRHYREAILAFLHDPAAAPLPQMES